MQSPRLGGSWVMMWCFSLVKLCLEINYNHSGRAKSCWFKQPFSGNFALNAPFPPTNRSWNQTSKLPQVVKLLASAKPGVQGPCQNHYLQLKEKHFFSFTVIQASPFSILFIWFHRVWGQKGWLDHLIWLAMYCKSLHLSYLCSPRWLWTQAFISSGNQTVGK